MSSMNPNTQIIIRYADSIVLAITSPPGSNVKQFDAQLLAPLQGPVRGFEYKSFSSANDNAVLEMLKQLGNTGKVDVEAMVKCAHVLGALIRERFDQLHGESIAIDYSDGALTVSQSAKSLAHTSVSQGGEFYRPLRREKYLEMLWELQLIEVTGTSKIIHYEYDETAEDIPIPPTVTVCVGVATPSISIWTKRH